MEESFLNDDIIGLVAEKLDAIEDLINFSFVNKKIHNVVIDFLKSDIFENNKFQIRFPMLKYLNKPKKNLKQQPQHFKKHNYNFQNHIYSFAKILKVSCSDLKRIIDTDNSPSLVIDGIELGYKKLPIDKFIIKNSKISNINIVMNNDNINYFYVSCNLYNISWTVFNYNKIMENIKFICSSLVYVNFQDFHFVKVKMQKMNNIRKCCFSNMIIDNSEFSTRYSIFACSFRYSTIKDVNFFTVKFTSCDFSKMSISTTKFSNFTSFIISNDDMNTRNGLVFNDCSFIETKFVNTIFNVSEISFCDFSKCVFVDCIFTNMASSRRRYYGDDEINLKILNCNFTKCLFDNKTKFGVGEKVCLKNCNFTNSNFTLNNMSNNNEMIFSENTL